MPGKYRPPPYKNKGRKLEMVLHFGQVGNHMQLMKTRRVLLNLQSTQNYKQQNHFCDKMMAA